MEIHIHMYVHTSLTSSPVATVLIDWINSHQTRQPIQLLHIGLCYRTLGSVTMLPIIRYWIAQTSCTMSKNVA